MECTIRPFNPATDYPARVAIMNSEPSYRVTEEGLRSDDLWYAERYQIRRTVAIADGEICGLGSVMHPPFEKVGAYRGLAIVRSEYRGKSLGSALSDWIEKEAHDRGATTLASRVRDDDATSLLFAERRGYQVGQHLFESVLELASFDPAPFTGRVEEVRKQGFRFLTMADLGESGDARERLYMLHDETGRDIPGHSAEYTRSYEEFVIDTCEARWYRAEGQIIAALGDEWVGLAGVGATDPYEMVNMHTGVRREFRGRGLAMALKLQAIDFARRSGMATLRTNNDSTNAPMIAINRKLGYRSKPGWLEVRKDL